MRADDYLLFILLNKYLFIIDELRCYRSFISDLFLTEDGKPLDSNTFEEKMLSLGVNFKTEIEKLKGDMEKMSKV